MDPYLNTRRSGKDTPHTHTRIGDKEKNISGGRFAIPDSEYESFMQLYYQSILVSHQREHLTERQLDVDGPILVDIDLRYAPSIKTRQHESDHVVDMMDLYMRTLAKMLDFPDNAQVEFFGMEKPDVNCLLDKTKDGIHLVIGLAMDRPVQRLLRCRILKPLAELWSDLPIINTWEDVLDEAVTKGSANWQMYGSRKPGHQAYKLKYHYTAKNNDGNWKYEEHKVTDFNFKNDFRKLSARYVNHPRYELSADTKAELANSTKPAVAKPAYTVTMAAMPTHDNIRSEADLNYHIDRWLESLENEQYRLKETHHYTMALPSKYYGPGSYSKWLAVGWALANTSSEMFLTWLKFSSQEGCRCTVRGNNNTNFDWNNVSELWDMWTGFKTNDPNALTHRSIKYWCKSDARSEYEKIHTDTLDYYVEDVIKKPTEGGLATVLYHMFAGRYVCVSIKSNVWYEFIGHRWHEIDSGTTLRLHISHELHVLFFNKIGEKLAKMNTVSDDSPQFERIKKDQNTLSDITGYLKTTQWKNNIMREAKDLFWDRTFIDRLDHNQYLLCFNNGVVDFTTNQFRPGRPEDCISRCTNIDYERLDHIKHGTTMSAIDVFFDQLFPESELRAYMWEHLASVLIGTNRNQTFNIYTGSGRNGKSIMVELMSKCLGTYKAQVPITLITQSRPSIGNTSSEIVQLMGVRYAVMQEPNKGDKINEGIMKEITGGDPIQGRALFKDTVTFMPQFKLVVCTNTLFDIKSNDDGTWRRIRVCDFKSKFIEHPYEDEVHFPKEEYPYQFKVDDELKEQFKTWAPVLASMLVEKAFQTKGKVGTPKIVTASSEDYREGQDYLREFTNEKIRKEPGCKIGKGNLAEEFTNWFKLNRGIRPPQMRELYDFMDSQYGKYKGGGWHNVAINFDE